jgi:deoxyribodipyrimidine photo-lyase
VTSIMWFRQDLRLADNAALLAAVEAGPVVPVYVFDEGAVGAAQHWWLHHSLTALNAALGGKLVLRRGDPVAELRALMAETGARDVHATRLYEPWWQAADAELGDELTLHGGNYLANPDDLRTGSGGRYKIFTPYWRALLERMPPPLPLAAPEYFEGVAARSDRLEDWKLLPTRPDWSMGFDVWTPGEAGAKAALTLWLDHVAGYDRSRNLPSEGAGVSRLSPHLHFGELSPATVWHHVAKRVGARGEPYLRELGWRDYAANTIDQFSDYGSANARNDFDRLKWRNADDDFTAWIKGRTGYPIVDAGMRELWATGWMHNRVRMIAASFLIKHLLIDWRRGEQWFRETLLDYDAASNAVNWQWVAGTGVDSNMFVRIMAPLSQSEKFDAGSYIRKWVRELRGIADDHIHDPEAFGERPRDYPAKIIGHREARERALAAYGALK